MKSTLVCGSCKSKVSVFGAIAWEVFSAICEAYHNDGKPVQVLDTDREAPKFWQIVSFLERKGFLITTEDSRATYQIKPVGFWCENDDENKLCHLCRWSKIDSE